MQIIIKSKSPKGKKAKSRFNNQLEESDDEGIMQMEEMPLQDIDDDWSFNTFLALAAYLTTYKQITF